jgi:hypothetical protein
MSVPEFFRRSWLQLSLGIIVPVAILFVSLSLSGVFAKPNRTLVFEVLQNREVVDVDNIVQGDVSVLYRGAAVPSLFVLSVRVRNASDGDILHSVDVAREIGLHFTNWDDSARLLSAPRIFENPTLASVEFEYPPSQAGDLTLTCDILRRHATIGFDLLYTASSPLVMAPLGAVRDMDISVADLTSLGSQAPLNRTAIEGALSEIGIGIFCFMPLLFWNLGSRIRMPSFPKTLGPTRMVVWFLSFVFISVPFWYPFVGAGLVVHGLVTVARVTSVQNEALVSSTAIAALSAVCYALYLPLGALRARAARLKSSAPRS